MLMIFPSLLVAHAENKWLTLCPRCSTWHKRFLRKSATCFLLSSSIRQRAVLVAGKLGMGTDRCGVTVRRLVVDHSFEIIAHVVPCKKMTVQAKCLVQYKSKAQGINSYAQNG